MLFFLFTPPQPFANHSITQWEVVTTLLQHDLELSSKPKTYFSNKSLNLHSSPILISLSCVIPLTTIGLNFVIVCFMFAYKLWCNYSPASCITVANHDFINSIIACLSFDLCYAWSIIILLSTIMLFSFSSLSLGFDYLISSTCSFLNDFLFITSIYSFEVTAWNWL
jgi:hypothetical protein